MVIHWCVSSFISTLSCDTSVSSDIIRVAIATIHSSYLHPNHHHQPSSYPNPSHHPQPNSHPQPHSSPHLSHLPQPSSYPHPSHHPQPSSQPHSYLHPSHHPQPSSHPQPHSYPHPSLLGNDRTRNFLPNPNRTELLCICIMIYARTNSSW